MAEKGSIRQFAWQTVAQEQMQTGTVCQMANIMDGANTRDEDGVDRVPDPPASLLPTLAVFGDTARAEGIDLAGCFQDAGGTQYGTISKRKFQSALAKAFNRFHFTELQVPASEGLQGCRQRCILGLYLG